MKTETQAIHAAYERDASAGAITPPIHLSTTFERATDGEYPLGHIYTRTSNPNRAELESRLAILEGGFEAAAFASGSVAMMSVLQALRSGDHVLAPGNLYYGIRLIMTEIFSAWGLETSFVDMTNLAAVETAIQANTRLIIIETPSNPLLQITHIQAVADIAHQNGALLVCDNTIPTPILQNPIKHGADLVVHATTKYISGHSDTLGGAVITKEDSEFWQRLQTIQTIGGAVPSPFDCWLVLRGLQTLPYRIKAHAENALQLAQFLDAHPKIEEVLYPGLPTHSGHDIACEQMSAFGGLMSVLVQGGQEEAMRVAANVQLFTRATSFGGTHSFIEHRASIEQGTTTPPNLLRLSIGIEHIDDLKADLEQALSSL